MTWGVGCVLSSRSREARPPSLLLLKLPASRGCARGSPRSGARHPAPPAPRVSTERRQGRLNRFASPTLAGPYNAEWRPRFPSCGLTPMALSDLVSFTLGRILSLVFRTSVLSPAGTARTLLGRPSSPGGCRSNPT